MIPTLKSKVGSQAANGPMGANLLCIRYSIVVTHAMLPGHTGPTASWNRVIETRLEEYAVIADNVE